MFLKNNRKKAQKYLQIKNKQLPLHSLLADNE